MVVVRVSAVVGGQKVFVVMVECARVHNWDNLTKKKMKYVCVPNVDIYLTNISPSSDQGKENFWELNVDKTTKRSRRFFFPEECDSL